MFPLGAIALLAVIAGIALLVLAYRFYRWSYLRAQRTQAIEDYYGPESHALNPSARSPGPGGFASLPSQISLGQGGVDSMGRRSMSGFGGAGFRNRQTSWGGDSWGAGGLREKDGGDFSPPTQGSRAGSPVMYDASRPSLSGIPTQSSSRGSLAGPPRRGIYSSSTSGSQILSPTRTMSSFSSPALGANAGVFPSGNRIAGAPHNPRSRIEVVPPAPLAPPPGLVNATDKSTLDFAPTAGIGHATALFGSNPALAAAAAATAAGPNGSIASAPIVPVGSSSGNASTNEEWDLISGEEAQEHLDVAHYATSPYSAAPSLSPIIPPSLPSSSSSSSSSSRSAPLHADPQPHQPLPRLPAGAVPPTAMAAFGSAPVPFSAPTASGSSGSRHPRLPSIDTGGGIFTSSGRPDVRADEEVGPKSPLEQLQLQIERERKGLSLQHELAGVKLP